MRLKLINIDLRHLINVLEQLSHLRLSSDHVAWGERVCEVELRHDLGI